MLSWRKSSYSIANGQCLEAAASLGVVLVRDTVSGAIGRLELSAKAWQEFTGRLKGAE